ncbi:hypothetical protein V6N13_047425 [Hibiscus sabdariffa]
MTIRTFSIVAELWNAHNLESDLLLELEELLHYEKLLWRQKSCSGWIQLGDRNTSYFHKKAMIRKVRNRITSLKISDGSWCDDEEILKDEAVAYYKSLFSLDQPAVNASTYYRLIRIIMLCVSSSTMQNDSIFSGIDAPINNTTSRVIAWSRQYSFVSSAAHAHQPVHDATTSSWSALSSPWVCLNIDGSACLRSSYARDGGVIRDCNGAWLAGFGRGIGIADPFTVELWAIYDGLSLAWQLGFEFVQVQSDCLKAISELSDTNASHGYPVLLRDILSLCQRSWAIEFLWVPRAANTVADHLLKQIPLTRFDMIHFDTPSAYLQSFLDHDINSPHRLTVA